MLKNIDKVTGLAATIATAAVTAAILPGVGAAGAGEAAGGAAIRHGAARAATATVAVPVIKKVLVAVHDLNPINMVSDFFAELWKENKIEEPMEHIGTEISTRAAREIETYFESEVFQPLERERDEVQSMLNQLETDRRTVLADRTAKVSRIDADIDCLQKLEV